MGNKYENKANKKKTTKLMSVYTHIHEQCIFSV